MRLLDPLDTIEVQHDMRSLASALGVFYKELKSEGLSSREALSLTGTLLVSLVKSAP